MEPERTAPHYDPERSGMGLRRQRFLDWDQTLGILRRTLPAFAATGLLLAACAPQAPAPPPLISPAPSFSQVGVASYYAAKFENHKTADGERFKADGMTAAHRTLPIGTMVRVTNLETQRLVVVRINDRGPFARHRVIDLSPAAAKALGIRNQGLMRVRIEALGQQAASQ
jgi:rare lipoprotein A